MMNGKRILEKLLDTNLGMLKIPKAVKDKFGTPTRYPNPDWRIGKDNEDVIEVVYIFDKRKLEVK